MSDLIESSNQDVCNPTLQDIFDLQNILLEHEQIDCPLKHHFSDGLYAREIFMPAGAIVVGKVHRHAHINNISQGRVRVYTTDGYQELSAPYQWLSAVGTKRVVHVLEDCVWTTYHPTSSTDLAEIERQVIVPEHELEQFLAAHTAAHRIGE